MDTTSIDTLLKQSADALDLGNLDVAAAGYEGVLEKESGHAEACLMLGSIYGEQGRLPEAIQLLETVLLSEPGDVAASLILANILHAGGDDSAAIDVLERASELGDDVELLGSFAELYIAVGDGQKASAQLEKAFQIDPSNSKIGMSLATCHMSAADYDNAEKIFRELLKASPNNFEASGFLAVSLAELDRLDEAGTIAREAVQQDLSNAVLHNCLAHVLMRQGNVDQAMESCDAAIALAPDDMNLLIKKAEFLEQAGDLDGAYDLVRPLIEADEVSLDAALVFVRLSQPLGKTEVARDMIIQLASSPMRQVDRQRATAAIEWLDEL